MTHALLTAWREFVDRAPSLAEDVLHREAEALYAESRRALVGDPSGREALVAAFRGTDDLARWLAGVVLPPGLAAIEDPDALRAHPEVRLGADELPVAVALALSLDHELADDPAFRGDPLRWTGSWVGGCPSVPRSEAPSWRPPTGPSGAPLGFVLQVDLGMEAANQGLDRWPATGLPDAGVLQVFHDLASDGWDDAAPGACHVRLADDIDVDRLVLADPGAAGAIVPLNPQLVPTCPSPPVPGTPVGDSGRAARHARVRDWLDLVAVRANVTDPEQHSSTPWHASWDPVAPVSRLGGFPHGPGDDPDLRACLEGRLPLAAGDRHVLLLDLDPRSPEARSLAGRPPGGHLEVWMRAGDLAAARFDDTWAVVRHARRGERG